MSHRKLKTTNPASAANRSNSGEYAVDCFFTEICGLDATADSLFPAVSKIAANCFWIRYLDLLA